MDWIGDLAKQVEAGVVAPEGMSHSFAVESREAERMVLPGLMMPVAVIARVCARRVRVGVMRVPEPEPESAGRMVRLKSIPAVSSTREEGKKRREETALRWGFARFFRVGCCGRVG